MYFDFLDRWVCRISRILIAYIVSCFLSRSYTYRAIAKPARAASPATAFAVGTAPAASDGIVEGGELVMSPSSPSSPPPAAEDDGPAVGEPGMSVVCMVVGIMVVSMECESLMMMNKLVLRRVTRGKRLFGGFIFLRRFPRAGDDGHVRRQRRERERRRVDGTTSQGSPFEAGGRGGRVLEGCWLDGESLVVSVAVIDAVLAFLPVPVTMSVYVPDLRGDGAG